MYTCPRFFWFVYFFHQIVLPPYHTCTHIVEKNSNIVMKYVKIKIPEVNYKIQQLWQVSKDQVKTGNNKYFDNFNLIAYSFL